jgi:N-hydroxyarylamine O-acetyltransferase
LDLPAYLRRIGLAAAPAADEAGLARVHEAHALAIPFENLDIHAGRPIRLELEALEAKLVRDRRGGYCFEQNRLFAAVLGELGFADVVSHHARVRMGRVGGPRTHKLLSVVVGGQRWLCDVGFGGDNLIRPLRFELGVEQAQEAWCYRLERDGHEWVLWSRLPEGWVDLYAFSDEPSLPIDDEVAHHFTSTHPSSRFVTTLTMQRVDRTERHVLRGRTYQRIRPDGRESVELDDAGILRHLRETFGLEPPPGLRLPG